jgi:hypothetical protein
MVKDPELRIRGYYFHAKLREKDQKDLIGLSRGSHRLHMEIPSVPDMMWPYGLSMDAAEWVFGHSFSSAVNKLQRRFIDSRRTAPHSKKVPPRSTDWINLKQVLSWTIARIHTKPSQAWRSRSNGLPLRDFERTSY